MLKNVSSKIGVLIINIVFIFFTSSYSQNGIAVSTAEKFNERGYSTTSSSLLDGQEIIGEFDGNLSLVFSDNYNLPNGLDYNLTITYNANIEHRIFRQNIGRYTGYSLNKPGWIIGIKGFALQTTNFETNFYMLNETRELSGEEVPYLIPGYHYTNRNISFVYGGDEGFPTNDYIQILKSDGSILNLYNQATNSRTGLYIETNSDGYGYANVQYITGNSGLRKMWYKPGDGLTYYFEEETVKYGIRDPGIFPDENPKVMYLKTINSQAGDSLFVKYFDFDEFPWYIYNPSNYGRSMFKGIYTNHRVKWAHPDVEQFGLTYMDYHITETAPGLHDLYELYITNSMNGTGQIVTFLLNTGSGIFDTNRSGQAKHTKIKYINTIMDELQRINWIYYYNLNNSSDFKVYRKYINDGYFNFNTGAYLPLRMEYYNGKKSIFDYRTPSITSYNYRFTGSSPCTGINFSNSAVLNSTYRDDYTNYMLESRSIVNEYSSETSIQNEDYDYTWGNGINYYSICDNANDIKTTISRSCYTSGNSSPTTTIITKNFSKYIVDYNQFDDPEGYGAGVIRLRSESIQEGSKVQKKINIWGYNPAWGNNSMYWLLSVEEQWTEGGVTSSKLRNYEYNSFNWFGGIKQIKILSKEIIPQSQGDYVKESSFTNFFPSPNDYQNNNFFYKLQLPITQREYSGQITKSHDTYSYYNAGEKIGRLNIERNNYHIPSRYDESVYDYYTLNEGNMEDRDSVWYGLTKSKVLSNGIEERYYYPRCLPYIWTVLKFFEIRDTAYGYLNTIDGQRVDTKFVTKNFQTKPFRTDIIYNNGTDTLRSYTSYDTRGNLQFEVDINGNYTEYNNDAGGRIVRAKFPGSFYSDGQTQFDTTYILQNLDLVPNELRTIGMGHIYEFCWAKYESDEVTPPDTPIEPAIEDDAKIKGEEADAGEGGGGSGGGNPSTRIYDFYMFFENAISMQNVVNLNYADLNLYTINSVLSPGQNKLLKISGVTQTYQYGKQVYETIGQKTFTFEDFSLITIDVSDIIEACKNAGRELYGFKISAHNEMAGGDLFRRFYFEDDVRLYISFTSYNSERSNARSSVLFTYDDINNKVDVIKRFNHDPQNESRIFTRLEYDSFGQLRKTYNQNSEGLFELKNETNYNYLGLKNDEKDAENKDIYYSYDYFSRVDTLYYDNAVSTYPYQTFGYTPLNTGDQFELKTIKDEENKTAKVYYLKNGLVDKEEKINGANTLVTDYTYDAIQRLTEVVPPKGSAYKSSYFYDGLSNIIQKTSPDEGTVKFKYDKYDNLRFSVHASAPPNEKALMFTKYDQFNRPLANGLLPANIGFDNLDADKDYSVNQSGFSHFENLNSDTANFVVVNMYDKFERTGIFSNISSGYGSILANIKNIYNLRGKLVATAFRDKPGDAWSYKLYGYDVLGRCRTMIVYFNSGSNRKTIANEYDNLGNLVKQIVNNEFHCWYDYDEQGRLKYVWSSIHNAKTTAILDASYNYNKADQVTQQKFLLEDDSFLKQSYGYNNRGWLSSTGTELFQVVHGEENPIEAPPFFVENLTYYKNGNVNTQTITNFGNNSWPVINFTYSYDGMNRLSQSSCSNSDYSETYMYDANGNFMHKFKNDPTTTIHYYIQNNSNKLESILKNNIQYSFNYDYRGNLTFDGYRGYSIYDYDHRNLPLFMNRMVIDMRFSYDDTGLRIYKDINGEKEYYLRDHTGKELAVYDLNTGKIKMANIYGNGLIGRADVFWLPDTCYDEGGPYPCDRREDELYYYIKDHLGSIRATLSRDGEIVAAQDYLPYGEIIPGRSFSSGGLNEKYKFTEKERDELNGYDYFGARYYDSGLARWQTVDPLADKYPGWSPYNYTLNNPLNFIDPDGKIVLNFDEDGNYIESVNDGNNTYSGAVINANNDVLSTFTFNSTNDAEAILSGKANADGLVIKGINNSFEGSIKDLIKLGTCLAEFSNSNIQYAAEQSVKGGLMDFVQYIATENYNKLVIVDNVAYNSYDAGNFVWGAAMNELNIPYLITRIGAEVNAIVNSRRDNNFASGLILQDDSGDIMAYMRGYHWNEK